ncbi:hypothetical protein BVRB_2g043930 [Beta vulgaris subsp. vulgaris]|nr:hypothetical protein BVRB_2g043930 [Beta vulgaris subsp. vulgaris]
MAASSSMNPLISSLVENGKTLASLLREAKTQHKKEISITSRQENLQNIYEKVGNVVQQILQKLECSQLPSFFPEKIILKVFEKIQTTLQKLIKLDINNAPKYEDLAKIINDSKSKKQFSAVGSASILERSKSPDDDSAQYEASTKDDEPQVEQFQRLTDGEKNCLISLCLFSAGKVIKKREAFHLWIGLELISDPLKGPEMLANLVAEGFIERTIANKKLCNRYNMNEIARSMIIHEMKLVTVEPHGSFSIMDQPQSSQQQQQQPPQQPARQGSLAKLGRTLSILTQPEDKKVLTTMVLNINENTLGATTFERLSKRKKDVKVLHLGSWDHNPKRYIMVEDIDALRALTKNMCQVTFLSFEGISGIVELPDSVYKLDHLKVLDLKACPNLESLSKGIDSLKQLTHLDLSECYLLDYIPKGIELLTELRVLKGFVINPEDPQVGNGIENGKNASTCALFSDLSKLKKLIKLTIRTRRMNFPTSEDFDTLYAMETLENLRIAWVWSSVDSPSASASGRFPKSLKKLEFQAAPENTMSRLLRLVSEDSQNSLEKLYIRGGRLWDLGMEMHVFRCVHTVRLRYLPDLRMDWDEFRKFFPELTRLEVSGCPNLIFFPCDENGVWEEAKNSNGYL